jgi:hypothetical protein
MGLFVPLLFAFEAKNPCRNCDNEEPEPKVGHEKTPSALGTRTGKQLFWNNAQEREGITGGQSASLTRKSEPDDTALA